MDACGASDSRRSRPHDAMLIRDGIAKAQRLRRPGKPLTMSR